MQDQNFRLSGHEKFALRFAWLPKALRSLKRSHNLFGDEDQAIVELGVGKNMVRAIRFWGVQTGMLEKSDDGHQPTGLGQAIFCGDGRKKPLDPYLEDLQTLWLLHWKLCTSPDPLYAWYRLVNEWHEPELVKSVLLLDAKRQLANQPRTSDSSLKSHLDVFFNTYTSTGGKKHTLFEDNLDCPLVHLRFIEECGVCYSIDGKAEPAYRFRREAKPEITDAMFLYCLFDFWRAYAPIEETLSVHEICNEAKSPGQVFKMPENEIRQRLERVGDYSDGVVRYMPSALLKSIHRQNDISHNVMSEALEGVYGN